MVRSLETSESLKRILPIPAPLLKHHGKTFSSPMREWVRNKKIPSALLITGISGVGKRTWVHYLAQWILCQRSGFGNSKDSVCGECPNCQRAIHGNCVDFIEIASDQPNEALKIDDFRKIRNSMGFGAHEGSYKIIFIPNAERMTLQAANSILKLLEEPPKSWVFFLTANDPTLVLPTIYSRCQIIRLKPLTIEGIQALLALSGISGDRAELCAKLGQGSWGRALALTESSTWEHRKTLFEFLKDPTRVLNTLAEKMAQETGRIETFIDQLESLTHDLILWSLHAEKSETQYAWVNTDGNSALTSHSQEVAKETGSLRGAREFWIDRAERLAQVRHQLRMPLNRKLLIQDVLLPWMIDHRRL